MHCFDYFGAPGTNKDGPCSRLRSSWRTLAYAEQTQGALRTSAPYPHRQDQQQQPLNPRAREVGLAIFALTHVYYSSLSLSIYIYVYIYVYIYDVCICTCKCICIPMRMSCEPQGHGSYILISVEPQYTYRKECNVHPECVLASLASSI